MDSADPSDPTNLDLIWHSLGGGAIVAAGLTLVRVLVEYGFRRRERDDQQAERRRLDQRDADARLERQMQERLSEAALRLERYEQEISAERDRRTSLERDYLLLQQAHHLLNDQFGALQTDHALLIGEHRLLLAAQQQVSRKQS
jgi:C4-dicarboxylate-specific signal transduction histidine kinase